jgi:acetyl-CoA carboxylase carboxyltransferase component
MPSRRDASPHGSARGVGVRALQDGAGNQPVAPWFATSRVWDDGIIDPRDTWTVLGICLSAVHSNVIQGTTRYGVFRM